MARILILSDLITEEVIGIAQGLASQRYEVVIATSQSEKENSFTQISNDQISFLFPFSKWSTIEALRFFPVLLSLNPNILQVIFSKKQSRPKQAHWVLSAAFRAIPHKIIAASLINENTWNGRLHLAHLKMYDLLTFATRMQLLGVKRKGLITEHGLAEVINPLPLREIGGFQKDSNLDSTQIKIRAEVESIKKDLGRFLLVPRCHQSILETLSNDNPEIQFVILGERISKSEKLVFIPDPNHLEILALLKKSSGLLLAFGEFSLSELHNFWMYTIEVKKPILANAKQAESVPGLCVDGRTGWILREGEKTLREIIMQNHLSKLPGDFERLTHSNITDQTLNNLIRLYNKAFEMRWGSA